MAMSGGFSSARGSMGATFRPSSPRADPLALAAFDELLGQTSSVVAKHHREAAGIGQNAEDVLTAKVGSNRYGLDRRRSSMTRDELVAAGMSSGKHDDATEAEILAELAKHNMEVYETRVAKAYVNEVLAQSLYRQKRQHLHNTFKTSHRETVQMNKMACAAVASPRTLRLKNEAHLEQTLTAMFEKETPKFLDVECLIAPFHQDRMLASRGLTVSATSTAEPASALEISRSVTLPPIGSLMNPRNQMTSPLPDLPELKRELGIGISEAMAAQIEKDKEGLAVMGINILTKQISKLLHFKRSADVELQRKSDLPQVQAQSTKKGKSSPHLTSFSFPSLSARDAQSRRPLR